MKKITAIRLAAIAAGLALSGASFAAAGDPPALTDLTSTFSLAEVMTGLMAIGVILLSKDALLAGIKNIIRMVKGA